MSRSLFLLSLACAACGVAPQDSGGATVVVDPDARYSAEERALLAETFATAQRAFLDQAPSPFQAAAEPSFAATPQIPERADVVDAFVASFDDPTSTFDITDFLRCTVGMDRSREGIELAQDLVNARQVTHEACASIFDGVLAQNEPCDVDRCADDYVCVIDACGGGTCRARSAGSVLAPAAIRVSGPCRDGQLVDPREGGCRDALVGDSCEGVVNDPLKSGLTCLEGAFVPNVVVDVGSVCSGEFAGPQWCHDQYGDNFCNADSICARLPGIGDSCAASGRCARGAFCDGERCQSEVPRGVPSIPACVP